MIVGDDHVTGHLHQLIACCRTSPGSWNRGRCGKCSGRAGRGPRGRRTGRREKWFEAASHRAPAQWVRMRTRVQNALHAIAMAHGVRRGHTLWNREGQALLASLPLAPHTAHRRSELQALYQHLDAHVDRLGERVKPVAGA
jgi:hypothetical protein